MSVQNTTKKVTSSEETAGILLDHTTESAVINSQLIPSTPQATLLFMQGYQEYQQGDIIQGGKVRIEYEPERLASCHMLYNGKPGWNLVGYVRFQPGGQLYTGALLNTSVNPPTAVSLDLPIPPDATDMELWFNNTDFTGCSVWDSRFGENYHYNVTSKDPLPPRQSVQYRAGAIASLEMVNVISEQTAKRKSSANTVETRLNILSWVKNVAFTKNVYVDIHVFDSSDNLILGETLGLAYAQPAGGGGDFFALDAAIYQSSTVRPEARKVQYRIYHEANGQVFTDAFLHSLNLPQDTEAV